jgi:hypothetical protein
MRRACLLALIGIAVGVGACWGGGDDPADPNTGGAVAGDRVALRSADSRNSTVAADSLANTRIGGPYGTVLAFRFRSEWTGVVRSVRFFVVVNSGGRTGYSGGSGGTLRIQVTADSGGRPHVPARRALATATLDQPTGGAWPLVRFRNPARVAAGRFYHIVFTNLDADPRRNYVSVNALVSHGNDRPAPPVPGGLAVLLSGSPDGGRTPGTWYPRSQRRGDRYQPIMEVAGRRADQHLGVGYMEVWVNNPKPIGGAQMVRQLIAPAAGKAIAGAWLRLRRRRDTDAPLTLRIERAGGGVLASASVPGNTVPSDHPGWVHVRFPSRVPLDVEPLALTASASARSSYETFPIRKGTEFGFHPRTMFDGGYAQFTQGGAWVGWDQWGGRNLKNGDLQFALDTVPR